MDHGLDFGGQSDGEGGRRMHHGCVLDDGLGVNDLFGLGDGHCRSGMDDRLDFGRKGLCYGHRMGRRDGLCDDGQPDADSKMVVSRDLVSPPPRHERYAPTLRIVRHAYRHSGEQAC